MSGQLTAPPAPRASQQNLQHVAVHSEEALLWGKLQHAALTNKQRRKKEKKTEGGKKNPAAVKAAIRGNRSGWPFQSHPVMVLVSIFLLVQCGFHRHLQGT